MNPTISSRCSWAAAKCKGEKPAPILAAEKVPDWDELMARITKAAMRHVEAKLEKALTEALGRPPTEEDITTRCRKMIHLDGTTEYAIDDQVLLRFAPGELLETVTAGLPDTEKE